LELPSASSKRSSSSRTAGNDIEEDENTTDLTTLLNNRREDSDFSDGSDADNADEAARRYGGRGIDDEIAIDDDDEESRVRQLEQDYDRAYKEYKQRQGIFEKKKKEKMGLTVEGNLIGTKAAEEEESRRKEEETKAPKVKRVHGPDSDTDSEEDLEEEEDGSLTSTSIKFGATPLDDDDDPDNGLLVKFDEKKAAAARQSKYLRTHSHSFHNHQLITLFINPFPLSPLLFPNDCHFHIHIIVISVSECLIVALL
jgi:hypothetical protein